MVKKDSVCTSCKSRLIGASGSVSFLCPSCGTEEIIRCTSCRKKSVKYVCPKCSFEGPN